MNIKIGDKVRFINDVGGGIVTAFIDEKTIEVQDDDGFEMPILATEVLVEPNESYDGGGTSENRREEQVKKSEIRLKPEDYQYKEFKGELLMAVVPENDKLLHVSDLSLYLINDSNYSAHYLISIKSANVSEFLAYGILEADTKMEIRKFTQSALSKVNVIQLQAFQYKEGLFDIQKPVSVQFNLDGVSFYKASAFSANEYFDSKAYLSKIEEFDLKEAVNQLSENELLKVTELKKDSQGTVQIPKKKSKYNEIDEIDLHIEAIVDEHAGLSNGEIVEIQLGRFETALETAIRSNTKRIVFIHGVGNGRLKHELRKKLDRKYPDLKYQDASFKEYGYGATLVYLM